MFRFLFCGKILFHLNFNFEILNLKKKKKKKKILYLKSIHQLATIVLTDCRIQRTSALNITR